MNTVSTEHFSLTTIKTPLGELTLAASDNGISHLAFPSDPLHLRNLIAIRDDIDDTPGNEDQRLFMLNKASEQLEEYFDKARQSFAVHLDLRAVKGFKLSILENLQKVPYGSRVTYSELAAASGSPTAVRTAGSACATNPVPILIPCHRVVKSGGITGNYVGGVKAKEFLLGLEG